MVYKSVRGWTSGRNVPQIKLLSTPPPGGGVCGGERCLRSFRNKNRLEMHFVVFVVTTAFVLLQPDGTDLFHFVDGYSTWNAYLTTMMADGTCDHVIMWLSMGLQTALKHAFMWSAVCCITMTL